MDLHKHSEEELRSFSKKHIETLESWLRRLIKDEMTRKHGENFFEIKNIAWKNPIKKSIVESARNRFIWNKWRYNDLIDATTFDDLISIIAHPENRDLFEKYFIHAYPNWNNEIRYFLWKLKNIRNKLYHVNPISIREWEQVICYTNDIIESFKITYKDNNMESEYNAPTFIRSIDSFWNEENSCSLPHFDYRKKGCKLRPWDQLSIEAFVDSTFDSTEYSIHWKCMGNEIGQWQKLNIEITIDMVGEFFHIRCFVISSKEWHRYSFYDDVIEFIYKVLPPI